MRSETTDAGSSLSASAVIALGGKKRGPTAPPPVFVHVCVEAFCDAALAQAPGVLTPPLPCSQSKY